jgi:hypothetical protein
MTAAALLTTRQVATAAGCSPPYVLVVYKQRGLISPAATIESNARGKGDVKYLWLAEVVEVCRQEKGKGMASRPGRASRARWGTRKILDDQNPGGRWCKGMEAVADCGACAREGCEAGRELVQVAVGVASSAGGEQMGR